MTSDRLLGVLRVLDDENHLLERADQKAVSLLSILGVFMVFFIVYYSVIPVIPFTVALVSIYFLLALLAILNLIMAVRPQIRVTKEEKSKAGAEAPLYDVAFFAGICKFPSLSAYKKSLENMIKDEESLIDEYTRQIFSLAKINSVKYKYLQRSVFLTIIALATELAIIVYLFVNYLGEGAIPGIPVP